MKFEQMQQHILEVYRANIEYLKKSQPALYKKIELFELGLDSGMIKEKYELEYKDEKYFDALNVETNEYLYNQNSETYGEAIVKNQLDFLPENCSFKAYYEVRYSDEVVKKVENATMFSAAVISNAPIIHYVNSNLPFKEEMKTIPKLIILGVGLGTHIPYICMQARAKAYFIVEPNLELFRLSLFTIKYYNLSTATQLYFSIADDDSSFNQEFNKFYGAGFIYNHYFKHFMFSKNCEMYIKLIQARLVSQTHLTYDYSRLIEGLDRTVGYIKLDYPILNIVPKQLEELSSKPVLFLAPGPSLQKNVEFVKENKDKFIIVAVFALMSFLEKNSIKPDIITHYDQAKDIVYGHYEKLEDKTFFNDSIFLFASHMDKKVIDAFPKERIFMFQPMYDIKVSFGAQTAPSIGEITYALLLRLGAKNIYMLGIDMALDPETNRSHIEEHISSKNSDFKDSTDNTFTLYKNLLETRGNFRDKVKTLVNFKMSTNTLNQFTSIFKKSDVNIYNLSDGAYFENTTPKKAEDIQTEEFELLDKTILKDRLYSEFKKK